MKKKLQKKEKKIQNTNGVNEEDPEVGVEKARKKEKKIEKMSRVKEEDTEVEEKEAREEGEKRLKRRSE